MSYREVPSRGTESNASEERKQKGAASVADSAAAVEDAVLRTEAAQRPAADLRDVRVRHRMTFHSSV